MRRSGRTVAATSIILAALSLSGCATSTSSMPGTTHRSATPKCTASARYQTIVLSDSAPIPSISVTVGARFAVVVRRWAWGQATEVSVDSPSVVGQICSIALHDRGRWTALQARRPGHSVLGATVVPASNLAMPAWMGRVTVLVPLVGVVSPTVSVRLRLSMTHQHAGRPIAGTAYIWDNTSRPYVVNSCASDGWLFIGLEHGDISFDPAVATGACGPTVHLKPGLNRFPIEVQTTYSSCARAQNGVTRDHPPCTTHVAPPLPPGNYATKLVVLGLPRETLMPHAISVVLWR
jgi:hypothetical protein